MEYLDLNWKSKTRIVFENAFITGEAFDIAAFVVSGKVWFP